MKGLIFRWEAPKIMRAVINWWRRKSGERANDQPTTLRDKPYLEPLQGSTRTVCAWRGSIISPTIHTLRIEHLRPIPSEERQPWQAFPGATHHVWVLYRLSKNSQNPIILISQQYDFSLPGQPDFYKSPDWVANRVGLWLCRVMISCPEWWLLRHSSNPIKEAELAPHRDYFWAEAIDKQYKRLSSGD